MDRRRLPFDGTVALRALEGQVAADQFTDGRAASVALSVAPLFRAPGQGQDKDVLFGASVTVISEKGDWAFVQCRDDSYCGYLRRDALGADIAPTHRVITRASHVYRAPDMKSGARLALSFGSRIAAKGPENGFVETGQGWVPIQHIAPARAFGADPVAYAETLLGTPYLWGGNSAWGIDCSGLVQAAFQACGVACPRDSDMQAAELGERLDPDAPLQRGDVICWAGHVGLMVDADTLIHANAHHMQTAIEPFAKATARIAAREFGAVTQVRRVTLP